MKDVMRSPLAMRAIRAALDEDLSPSPGVPGSKWLDATTLALAPAGRTAEAVVYSKSDECVVSGATVAKAVVKTVDPRMRVRIGVLEGGLAKRGAPIIVFGGSVRSILAAERTALNFMQRMCGIATLTRKFVNAVKRYGTMILDTRKTTPGLRVFEKYAVLCGGGSNHRMGLYDRILIKDNHRRLWCGDAPDRLDEAVRAARKAFPKLPVEVEVESIEECESALKAEPEWIMLDNMSEEEMKKCVRICKGISKTEASGGITLERAKAVAATGVTAISLGCLTHSAGSVDLSLEWKAV